MTKTVTIKGYVYEADYGSREGVHYSLYHTNTQSDQWNTLVGPAEFSYELPATYNPTASKLAALEAKKTELQKQYAARVKELNDQISKLQAIEYVEA